MTEPNRATYSQSASYTIFEPEQKDAFIMPFDDWIFIKNKIKGNVQNRCFFTAMASWLWGTAATTFISMLVEGTIGESVIRWVIVGSTALLGLFAILFSHGQNKNDHNYLQTIVDYMENIEKRVGLKDKTK